MLAPQNQLHQLHPQAAPAAEDKEDDEPRVLSTGLLAVLRSGVKRMCRSLDSANVKFRVYNKAK